MTDQSNTTGSVRPIGESCIYAGPTWSVGASSMQGSSAEEIGEEGDGVGIGSELGR